MITSEFSAFNFESESDYCWLLEETELPLILVNLQDSFNFLIEQVNPLKLTV